MKLSATLLFLNIFALSYAQAPKNYTIEEFLKAPNKELLKHKLELDTLIKQKKLNIPQSQAMLFYPDPIENQKIIKQNLSDWTYKMGKESQRGLHKVLNDALITENQANTKGNMVLYHSTQPYLYAQSYINTQLQKLALELKGKKVDTETLLMRDLNEPRSYEEEKAKRKELLVTSASPEFTDRLSRASEYLISTNPAITSNVVSPLSMWEATLYYFLSKKNLTKPQNIPTFIPKDNKLLEETIKRKTDELSRLVIDLKKKTNSGILLQFIVKDNNLARKILYNAELGGTQYATELQGNLVYDPVTILQTIRTNPNLFKALDPSYGYKSFKKTDIPQIRDTLVSQQMRLVVSGDKLLDLENPAVKEFDVKAYSGSDKSLKEFQQKVDTAIQEIRSNYLKQKQQMSWPKRIQYGARDLFYRRQSPWEQRQQYKRMLRGDIGSPFE